jgi:repressor LexA
VNELTERQTEILDFIRSYIAEEHLPPAVADIARAFGFRSPNAVTGHLKALRRKGHIRLRPGRARNIELVRGLGLPVIGRVAAGAAIEAIENTEKVIEVPGALFRLRPDYLLRVRGDSMVGRGILDNDLIAVKKRSTANPGEIVVARYNDEVTVKELQIDNGDVVLLPANDAYEPIRIAADQVYIEGVYAGLVREH